MYSSKNWTIIGLQSLMSETSGYLQLHGTYYCIILIDIRRKWIIDDHPHVTQILEEFPCLMQPTLVNTNYVNHVCIFCS